MSEPQTIVHELDIDETAPQTNGHAMSRHSAVTLKQLPDGVDFPSGMRDRVTYDPERKLLIFRGYMSSADYCFLRSYSDDPEYVRALNDLHEKSAFEIHCRTRIVPLWLWALVSASFALAALVWLGWLIGAD
jgi:hypothetical protein